MNIEYKNLLSYFFPFLEHAGDLCIFILKREQPGHTSTIKSEQVARNPEYDHQITNQKREKLNKTT